MADCAAIASCVHLQLQRIPSKACTFMPNNVHIRISPRQRFPSPNAEVSISRANFKGSIYLKEDSLRCCCLGTLTNPETVVLLNWVPVVDQVLLMASIVLTYMAGVLPQERIFSDARNSRTQDSGAANSTSYGRDTKSDTKTNITDSWSEVEGKLADALDAIESNGRLDSRTENYSKRHLLNLFAVFEGPRLRLLWITLQQLQKEVNNILQTYEVVNYDVWAGVTSEVIKGSVQPVCVKWLEEELALEIEEPDTKLFSRISAMLKGDETILQNITRLGKGELYAELLFFLRFGSVRTGCCYDSKLLAIHGVDILEDLVVTLADGITSIYLGLISVDSSMANEVNGLGITVCNLSTRLLQRLRNEVALKQWLQQNFESVISMYEDRFELFVLQREQLEDPHENRKERHTWWKNFAFQKSAPSSLHHLQIKPFPLPIKRIKELRALTGWKYYFSLCLEFSDITMPLVRAVFSKVRSAVSFFLVYLIGRSLGLIYSGIRQSLGWR